MNSITKLFKIEYPVVQGGMIWCSGWRLASAVSNSGGLGLIGAGSMDPDLLREHIKKCKAATDKPFGVNIPLLFTHAEQFINIVIEERVPIVFTSAGSPAKYTARLKENGITVAHVVAGSRFAVKCEEAGVDAVVAEGFEAGGHNGPDETTTMALIPMVRESISLPLIAAGGVATGRSMLAAFALGANGVQIGTRFVTSEESSAHPAFKKRVVDSLEGETKLTFKKLFPVRLLKNSFYQKVKELEDAGAGREEFYTILGKGLSKLGMFEGDLENGELEIGQVSGLIKEIKPAADIMKEIIAEYNNALKEIKSIPLRE
jgi:enoyl-[acyl-carrier protein] reductase II